MTADRPSLAAAFAPPARDRAATLSKPAPRKTAPPPAPTTAPAAQPEDWNRAIDVTDQTPGERARDEALDELHDIHQAETATKPTPAGPDETKTVVTYLNAEDAALLRTYCQNHDCTHADALVQAFAHVPLTRICAILDPPPTTTSPMPTGKPTRPKRSRVQVALRLTRTQQDWLADQTELLGARTRTALIEAAYTGLLRPDHQPT